MQDGQLCLLSPGEGGGHCQIVKKGEEKQKEKTSWVECGASRVEEGEGGQRALLFLCAHYQRAKLILQANG